MRTEVLMLVFLFVVDVVRAFVPAAAALAPRSYTTAAARSTAAAIVPQSTAVAVEDDEMVDDKVN
jgi:predicted alpha-1,6-mannanase (GH76 family)